MAEQYVIQRAVNDGPWEHLTTVTGAESWVDPGPFEGGAIYHYRIRQERDGVVSEWSEPVSVTYAAVEHYDEILSVSAPAAVAISDWHETQTGYHIQRAAGDGPWQDLEILGDLDADSWIDPGPFEDGVTYSYRIRQVIAGVPGEWSNTVSVAFKEGPPVPEHYEEVLTVEARVAGSISMVDHYNEVLQISVPVAAVVGELYETGTGYLIQRSAGGEPWQDMKLLGDLDADSWTDPGPFEDGITYYYRIRRVIAGVSGGWSNIASVTFWKEPPIGERYEDVLTVAVPLVVSVEELHFQALAEELNVMSAIGVSVEDLHFHALAEYLDVVGPVGVAVEETYVRMPVHYEELLAVSMPVLVTVEEYFLLPYTDLRRKQVEEIAWRGSM